MVPLDTLAVTYGGTSNAWPLSNAYKNQITQFQDMYDHCNSQTTWSDHNIFDLTSSHFDSYCFLISQSWLVTPVLPLWHCTYAPTCHQIPLVSPKCSNDGEESGALTSLKHLSQEPHYIHDETSDASANSDLTHILGHGLTEITQPCVHMCSGLFICQLYLLPDLLEETDCKEDTPLMLPFASFVYLSKLIIVIWIKTSVGITTVFH
jgi:hypothetical protein